MDVDLGSAFGLPSFGICRDRGLISLDDLADVFSEVAEIRLKLKYHQQPGTLLKHISTTNRTTSFTYSATFVFG
jgi:hypothetical protein